MEQQRREYGLFTTIAMIVGIVIGSGIFFKSDNMLGYTGGSVGLAVLVFCIAAFTIVFGCLSFSQLAALTDKPGGVITYANEFIGKRWASMFGWFQVFHLLSNLDSFDFLGSRNLCQPYHGLGYDLYAPV